MAKNLKAVLFFNPKSGRSKLDPQLGLIKNHFDQNHIALETVLVPKPAEEIKEIINKAISNDVNIFMAAGGDGTVSMISTHLVGTEIPVGIIPLGTGNVLAKALHIPLNLEKALELITTDDHSKLKIDTFKMDGHYFVLNVSVGLSPEIMRSVSSGDKQRLGFFAYLINFFQQLLGLKVHRIVIDCDHQLSSHLASEILITNVATAGMEPFFWSDDIQFNDGTLDLLIFRTKGFKEILRLVISVFTKKCKLNPEINFMQVKEYCRIESPTTLHTQADGDVVGKTPFEIRVYPSSLSIIVGKEEFNNHQNQERS